MPTNAGKKIKVNQNNPEKRIPNGNFHHQARTISAISKFVSKTKRKEHKRHGKIQRSFKFHKERKKSFKRTNKVPFMLSNNFSPVRKKKSIISSTGLFVIKNDVNDDDSKSKMTSSGDVTGNKRTSVNHSPSDKKLYKVELPMALAKLLFPKVMNDYEETLIQIYPVPNTNGGKTLMLKVSHKDLKDEFNTTKALPDAIQNDKSHSSSGSSMGDSSISSLLGMSSGTSGSSPGMNGGTSGISQDMHGGPSGSPSDRNDGISNSSPGMNGGTSSSNQGMHGGSSSSSPGMNGGAKSDSSSSNSNKCFPGGPCSGCCNECCPGSK